jgi:ribosomal protein S18 acetylase RimI-like enzyme
MTETRDESTEGHAMNFSIAPPTMEDAALIGSMHLQSWIETYQNPELGIDEDWIREKIGHVADESGTVFRKDLFEKIATGDENIFYRVAKDTDGKIVGFVMAQKGQGEAPNSFDALYTLKEAQGQSLGSTLIKQVLTWLGDDKPTTLEVVSYNQHAIEFYERYGFKLTGKKHMYKYPMEASEMVKV